MKITTVLAPLIAAVTAVNAKALLAVFEDEVTIGKTYKVEWLSDEKQHLELLLVKRNPNGWDSIETLFKHRLDHKPGGHYYWTVDDSITPGRGYGLWLSSTPIPNDGTGYADLTSWFKIKAPQQNMKRQEFVA